MLTAFFRTVILYLLLMAGLRLTGKRQLGQLEPTELVLMMLLSDLAAVPMQDFGIPLLMGVIPIITLLCLSMILSILSMKSLKLRALLVGTPSILIKNGKLNQKEMRRNRMTLDEILEELRLQGYTELSSIKYAVLETNGQLSLLPYANQKPPTAKQLDIAVSDSGLPLVLINDGRLISANLRQRGLDEVWLKKRLAEHKVHNVRDVFLLTIDEENQLYFVRKELK